MLVTDLCSQSACFATLPGPSSQAQTVTPSFPTNPFVTGSTALTVFNTEEQPVPMAELTRGKTVLALLRHFGCPLCW